MAMSQISMVLASTVVGETRVPGCCDQSGLISCETPPVCSLGVIGVHYSACHFYLEFKGQTH
jgi:hypothetical protein